MTEFYIGASLAIFTMVAMCLFRAIKGPTIIDRIVAINVIGTKTIAVILMMGYIYERVDMFMDIALIYALINFMGSLAMAKYFERKGIVAGDSQ